MERDTGSIEGELSRITREHRRLKIVKKEDGFGNFTYSLRGNLIIPHSNGSYLLPIMVNFPPNYPSDPPLVQVDMGCVSPMELNLQCGLIDSSGRIRHPYLDDWSTGIPGYNSPSTARFLTHLIKSFSNYPPIYVPKKILEDTVKVQSGPPPIPPKVPGRPEPSPAREGGHYRHYPAPTDAPQYPFPAPGHQGAPYPPHGDYRPGGPFVPPKRYSATPMPQEYHQQPPGPGEPRYDNAGVSVPPKISNNSANFLLSFINSNDSPIAKLEKIIDGCNLTLSHDLIAIMDKSTYAKDSERSIASAINKLKERRVGLLGYFAMYLHTIHKDDVRILKDRVNFLSESLEGAVQYIKSGPTIPPAEIVLCANPQQNKLIELLACDITCSDLLYHLNKYLDLKLISLSCFISEVRRVAHDQFIARKLFEVANSRINDAKI